MCLNSSLIIERLKSKMSKWIFWDPKIEISIFEKWKKGIWRKNLNQFSRSRSTPPKHRKKGVFLLICAHSDITTLKNFIIRGLFFSQKWSTFWQLFDKKFNFLKFSVTVVFPIVFNTLSTKSWTILNQLSILCLLKNDKKM